MAMPVAIRAAAGPDADALAGLMAQLGYDVPPAKTALRLTDVLQSPEHKVWVAEIESTVVGMVHQFEHRTIEAGSMLVVQALVIAESHRRWGIGRALMNAVEAHAKECGMPVINLSSRDERTEAHRFYQSLGFEMTGLSATFIRRLASG